MGTTGESAEAEYRYAAFISYRHTEPDRRWAKWLHRTLETYRVPRRLIREGLPPRVGRCFRDEEELPASANLSQEIEFALYRSRFLIVVCSPRTPESQWVNREVELFREMGRHDRILALLVEGDPGQSFPRALCEIRRTVVDEEGKTHRSVEEIEPLAADVRPTRRERKGHLGRMAKLRLLACLLGITFDDLRQREQERRTRRFVAAGIAGVALLCVLAGLTVYAFSQRNAARANEARANQNAAAARTNLGRALKGEAAANANALTAQANAERASKNAKEADRQRAESARRLAEMYSREGYRALDGGDESAATVWFAEAASAAEGAEAPRAKARLEMFLRYATAGRLLLPPLKHDGRVTHASFSRDGSRILTASDSGKVHIWDAATGKATVPPLETGKWVVDTAEFSPDGRRVLTVAGGRLQLWDAATGKPVPSSINHDAYTTGATYSPDGRWVATSGKDATARLWDAKTGALHVPPLVHQWPVVSLTFSADAKCLLTIDSDGTDHGSARVWETATGRPLTPAIVHDGQQKVYQAAFSPDGSLIATSGADQTVRFWSTATGETAAPALKRGSDVYGLSFLDNNTVLIAGGGGVVAWDVTGGVQKGWIGGTVNSFAIDPASDHILTADDTVARISSLATGGQVSSPMPQAEWGMFAHYSPGGNLVLSGSADGTARVWDARRRDTALPLRHEQPVLAAQFSPDSKTIFTDSGEYGLSGTTSLWDARTGKPAAAPVTRQDGTQGVMYSNDGLHMIVFGDGTFRVCDTRTRRPITLPIALPPKTVCTPVFSPDGSRVAYHVTKETLRLLDTATGQPVTPPMRHDKLVSKIVFSPDGARLLTVTLEDYATHVWDARTGQPLTPPFAYGQTILDARFVPGGGVRVLTAAFDNARATVWDGMSGRPIHNLGNNRTRANEGALSPDGRRAYTIDGNSNAVSIWDTDSGTLAAPRIPYPQIPAVTFNSDWTLMAAWLHGAARVSDVRTGRPISPLLVQSTVDDGQAIFSPDSARLLTSSGEEVARVWDLTPSDRPLADLKALAEFHAARRIDPLLGLVPLSPDDLAARYARLVGPYPDEFRPAPPEPPPP